MDEFALIRRFLAPLARGEGAAGLRDDVAEVSLAGPAGGRLIVTTDTLVEGVHFLPDDPCATIGAKLARVNLSDIVCKGGRPHAAFFNLVWPKGRDTALIGELASGLAESLAEWGAELAGGDTTSTQGPLVVSLTVLGWCGPGGPVRRAGAAPGEDVWVTGAIGDGWLGLQVRRGEGGFSADDSLALVEAYQRPSPPPLGFADLVAKHATASVDVSDGLLADAGHVADASGCGLDVQLQDIPLSPAASRWLETLPDEGRLSLITGGDDYQTLFTAPADRREALLAGAGELGLRLSRIGRTRPGSGVRLLDADGQEIAAGKAGWTHF